MGGAIVKDKVWFYGAARFQENNFYLAGNYANKNAGDPTKWLYDPDFNVRALDWIPASRKRAGTWQANQKHRLSFHYEQQSRDIWSGNALIAPESTGNFMFPKNNSSRPAGRLPSPAGCCSKCAARIARRRSWWRAPVRRRSATSRGLVRVRPSTP